MAIEEGDTVHVHYTGTLDNGEEFDTSRDREPLAFQVGGGQVLPKFEEAVVGKKVGDTFELKLDPEDAYGEVRDDLVHELPKEQFEGAAPEPGMHVHLQGPQGETLHGDVKEVTDDAVTVDLNHPLAGERLNFEVEVVDVEGNAGPATPTEPEEE